MSSCSASVSNSRSVISARKFSASFSFVILVHLVDLTSKLLFRQLLCALSGVAVYIVDVSGVEAAVVCVDVPL
jgi:hypothetical protein